MKVIALFVLGLVLIASAAAAPIHPGQVQRASLSTKLCQKRKILHTRTIPANAHPQAINATVNGHWLHGWNESQMVAGLGGYGVVVQVTLQRKAGPATVRLASARDDCARIHVLIVWR